ncbi:hypothetical protein PLICRDRAFT_110003, partial [Plicaturopsis crispa FD-325 SS-3]
YYGQQQHSPFIPPAHLYPSSPYHPSSPLPDVSPPHLHYDDGLFMPPMTPRPRRPSWHAGMSTPAPTFAAPPPTPSTPFLSPPSIGHNRRHSHGNIPFQNPWPSFGPATFQQPTSPWTQHLQPPPPQFLMHPFLNGEVRRTDIIFDLSSPYFTPERAIGPGQTAPLTVEECAQAATHPPITHMRIVCDVIPQWPIELRYNFAPLGSSNNVLAVEPQVPISLGDVLVALHRELQTPISYMDWGRLSRSEETAIARAYTRRCKSVPEIAETEFGQGVRRVDFLLDRYMFKGLVRIPGEQGWENVKLIV